MNLDTLRNAEFGRLDQAITAWNGVVTKLKALETEARDDLKAKADKANWAGVNATVTRGSSRRRPGSSPTPTRRPRPSTTSSRTLGTSFRATRRNWAGSSPGG